METQITVDLNTAYITTNPVTGAKQEEWYTSRTNDQLRDSLAVGLVGLTDRVDLSAWHKVNISTLVETEELQERTVKAFGKLQSSIGFDGNITKATVHTKNGIRYSVKLWKDKLDGSGITINI